MPNYGYQPIVPNWPPGNSSRVRVESGYQRVTPHYHPDAVHWWVSIEFESGYVYARGGTCRTTREARAFVDHHVCVASAFERQSLDRPTHLLLPDGSLGEIDYGPYGACDRKVRA